MISEKCSQILLTFSALANIMMCNPHLISIQLACARQSGTVVRAMSSYDEVGGVKSGVRGPSHSDVETGNSAPLLVLWN